MGATRCTSFAFNHDNKYDFIRTSSKKPVNTVYMVCLWVSAIICASSIVLGLYDKAQVNPTRWPILFAKATYQVSVLATLYLLLQAGVVTQAHMQPHAPHKVQDSGRRSLSFIHKFLWALHPIATVNAIGVVFTRWTFLTKDVPYGFVDIGTHGLNLLFLLAELVWLSRPVRWQDFWLSFLYPVWYLAFLATYWALGGTDVDGTPYLYTIFNYEEAPVRAVLMHCGSIAGGPVFHMLLVALHKLRQWVVRRCKTTTTTTTLPTDVDTAVDLLTHKVQDV